jgi:hypothetical protein
LDDAHDWYSIYSQRSFGVGDSMKRPERWNPERGKRGRNYAGYLDQTSQKWQIVVF